LEKFLKKIKLVRDYSIPVPMDRKEFVRLAAKNIDIGNNSIFSLFSERFSSSKNKYVGELDYNGFQFRKRKKIIDFNKNSSVVKGVFRQKGDKLYMETEIKPFSIIAITVYVFIVLFFIYFVGFKLVNSAEPLWSIVSALLIQASLLFGVPYLVARSRIKRMYIELRKDIYNWMLGTKVKF